VLRSTRSAALLFALILPACTDRTGPEATGFAPQASRDMPAAARERLARRLALALADEQFRLELKRDLDRSPVPENKLHLQRYLITGRARATANLARVTGESDAAVELDTRRAPELELYLPVPAHREAWTGDERILVATTGSEHSAPVGYTTRGERVVLSPDRPPDIPVLALVPAETDFDLAARTSSLRGGNSGGSSPPPPGLYLTRSHLVETFESWVKGSPEIEVHMLGQAGKTDSLTTYACAAEPAGGYYRFDQNSRDWSGSVLLMSQTQLDSYRKAHPGQNLRVFFVEDDDGPCQIRTDPARFSRLVKAVEAAYPLLTGGRDSSSGTLQKVWKRAHAIQQILKALGSLIKTDDELIGNAVESAVVGESYPNANWVIKGDNNRTTGWVRLIMK
jgi:hypothetical protein